MSTLATTSTAAQLGQDEEGGGARPSPSRGAAAVPASPSLLTSPLLTPSLDVHTSAPVAAPTTTTANALASSPRAAHPHAADASSQLVAASLAGPSSPPRLTASATGGSPGSAAAAAAAYVSLSSASPASSNMVPSKSAFALAAAAAAGGGGVRGSERPSSSMKRSTTLAAMPASSDRIVSTSSIASTATVAAGTGREAQLLRARSHAGPSVGIVEANTAPRRRKTARVGGGVDLKVVILGAQGVGKTSLVHRYTTGQFSASSIPSTIGASFLTQKLVVDGNKVRLQLWDTAGQERFRSMAPMYYRGSNAAVIVYDITNEASFADVRTWIHELRKNVTSDLVIHVVGSKLDLAATQRQVYLDDARAAVAAWTQAPSSASSSAVHSTLPSSPTRSSSRLGLGNLSLGGSRLGFPRNPSTPPGGSSTPAVGGDSSGSGSGSSDGTPAGFASHASSWECVEVSEVSAKAGEGIEDVFVSIASRLVERKADVEEERRRRERDSVVLQSSGADAYADEEELARKATAGWSCCA